MHALTLATLTDFTVEALKQVRNPHLFEWYAIPLLAFVFYVYAQEVERGRWDMVAAGLAVWMADGFNEIVNALILHWTHTAALWTETGRTAYQFTVGLNVETMFMFAVAGIVFAKFLPADRRAKILGLPNRFALALGMSLLSVAIEVFLHATGSFHWHYWFWGVDSLPVIVIFGYLWFYMYAAWVYDADAVKRFTLVGGLAAVNAILILVFGVGLGWL
ncbi:MAG: hypothetical protein FWD04_01450 [Conexibacteraceae bacterium]|nr:hypothetical protein [Conexibacteraceae bacterium]